MRLDWSDIGAGFSPRRFFELDYVLLTALLLLAVVSCVVLYSAGGQDLSLIVRQGVRFGIGFGLLLILAQVPVAAYRKWSLWLYVAGVLLLLLVLFAGDVSKGAQRWLDLWVVKFQPSELLKLVVPMALCWLFASDSRFSRQWKFVLAWVLLLAPVMVVLLQPDLGTAALITMSGLFVIFLAGFHWVWIGVAVVLGLLMTPLIWHFLFDYQKQRMITFFNPESDPLGAGYHIIQSKIAIGSGGVWGKGWLQGSQSQLDFIPERVTDFVFTVFSEEFGFVGICVLMLLYALVIVRGTMICVRAADEFGRLLTGAFILTFFLSLFVNISMVSGLLPVVGVPLPLVSYGGTSVVTLLASFGILMSIARYRPMLRSDL